MTTAQLLETWLERDRRYARRRFNGKFMPLAPAEEMTIRAWRLVEVSGLPSDHGVADQILAEWQPPVEVR